MFLVPYTWLKYMSTVPTQPTWSAVCRYIEEMLIYQRKLKISKFSVIIIIES